MNLDWTNIATPMSENIKKIAQAIYQVELQSKQSPLGTDLVPYVQKMNSYFQALGKEVYTELLQRELSK